MDISQALAHALLAASGDAIIATDRDGVIRFWNPGAERIFGYARAEALGQSLDLIIPERVRARHWDGYRRFIATGRKPLRRRRSARGARRAQGRHAPLARVHHRRAQGMPAAGSKASSP
jgi:PAS domain S-box-containing protein